MKMGLSDLPECVITILVLVALNVLPPGQDIGCLLGDKKQHDLLPQSRPFRHPPPPEMKCPSDETAETIDSPPGQIFSQVISSAERDFSLELNMWKVVPFEHLL